MCPYQTIELTYGYKVELRDGNVVTTVLPVFVPEKVPPDKPTSRQRRIMIEVLADIHERVGIAEVPPYAETPVSNEAKEIMEDLSKLRRPRRGMLPVEDFRGRHLRKLHRYVSESFWEVVNLGFRPYVGVAIRPSRRKNA